MIQKLFIDEAVADSPLVEHVKKRLHLLKPVFVKDSSLVQKIIQRENDPIEAAKNILFLTRNRGAFVKPCPGTKSYLCCGYQILNLANYCTMDCSYCILQAYFTPPVLQYFVNTEDLYGELESLFSNPSSLPFHRIGTGEFTDSLIWENWIAGAEGLIRRFAKQDQVVLELKTKTTSVAHLKGLSHEKKTIVSWSLNPPSVISGEERRTATLHARLKAANQCQSWGYPLAFHFDPMVLFDGWENQYRETVRNLFQTVSPDNIVWISLGSFRFIPTLKEIIARRFPQSKIAYGEFIRGLDGKMRYFKPLRVELYKKMVCWIREWAPDVTIYLCMEDEEVWQKALGFVPERASTLTRTLDLAASKHCGIRIGS